MSRPENRQQFSALNSFSSKLFIQGESQGRVRERDHIIIKTTAVNLTKKNAKFKLALYARFEKLTIILDHQVDAGKRDQFTVIIIGP